MIQMDDLAKDKAEFLRCNPSKLEAEVFSKLEQSETEIRDRGVRAMRGYSAWRERKANESRDPSRRYKEFSNAIS